MILVLHSALIKKASLVADGNSHRDPQLDNVQRMKTFGALNPKWDVFNKLQPSGLRELCRKGSRMNKRDQEWVTLR